jgi:hypothetical protein
MKKKKRQYVLSKCWESTYTKRQHNNPADWQLQSHRHENLTTHTTMFALLFTEN